MPSVNEKLFDATVQHAVGIERFKQHEVNSIVGFLNRDVLPDVRKKVQSRLSRIRSRGFDTGPWRTKQLRELEQAVEITMRSGARSAYGMLRADLQDLAIDESQFTQLLLKNATPNSLGVLYKSPSPTLLRAIVTKRPFEGRLLRDWWKSTATAAREDISRQIRIGLAEGESTRDIMRRVVGTRSAAFGNGSMARIRRNAESITRSAVNHTVTQAREDTYKENSDVIKGVQIVATLDSRTTERCMAEDGKVYPINSGPRPPLHIGCRSTTIPITKSWKELGAKKKVREAPPAARASMNGQVPAKKNYNEWLRTQSRKVQDEALGPERGELFRRGELRADQLVDKSGQRLTLKQLRGRTDDIVEDLIEEPRLFSPRAPVTETPGPTVGLPDGWRVVHHETPSGRKFKTFHSPDGETFRSLKTAKAAATKVKPKPPPVKPKPPPPPPTKPPVKPVPGGVDVPDHWRVVANRRIEKAAAGGRTVKGDFGTSMHLASEVEDTLVAKVDGAPRLSEKNRIRRLFGKEGKIEEVSLSQVKALEAPIVDANRLRNIIEATENTGELADDILVFRKNGKLLMVEGADNATALKMFAQQRALVKVVDLDLIDLDDVGRAAARRLDELDLKLTDERFPQRILKHERHEGAVSTVWRRLETAQVPEVDDLVDLPSKSWEISVRDNKALKFSRTELDENDLRSMMRTKTTESLAADEVLAVRIDGELTIVRGHERAFAASLRNKDGKVRMRIIDVDELTTKKPPPPTKPPPSGGGPVGLPAGWRVELRTTATGRKYKVYISPKGKSYQSLKKAREAARGANPPPPPPPKPIKPPPPKPKPPGGGTPPPGPAPGLRQGWLIEERTTASGRKYKVYKAPDGRQFQSLKKAQAHDKTLGGGTVTPPPSRTPPPSSSRTAKPTPPKPDPNDRYALPKSTKKAPVHNRETLRRKYKSSDDWGSGTAGRNVERGKYKDDLGLGWWRVQKYDGTGSATKTVWVAPDGKTFSSAKKAIEYEKSGALAPYRVTTNNAVTTMRRLLDAAGGPGPEEVARMKKGLESLDDAITVAMRERDAKNQVLYWYDRVSDFGEEYRVKVIDDIGYDPTKKYASRQALKKEIAAAVDKYQDALSARRAAFKKYEAAMKYDKEEGFRILFRSEKGKDAPSKWKMDGTHVKARSGRERRPVVGKITGKSGTATVEQKAMKFYEQLLDAPPENFENGTKFGELDFVRDSRRAYYSNRDVGGKSAVHLARNGGEYTTAVHEIGHHLEYATENGSDMIHKFRRSRIKGKADIDMGKWGMKGEKGNPDEFEAAFREVAVKARGRSYDVFAAYAGKNYGRDATELISMGLELLAENPIAFAKADPEWAELCLRVVFGELDTAANFISKVDYRIVKNIPVHESKDFHSKLIDAGIRLFERGGG